MYSKAWANTAEETEKLIVRYKRWNWREERKLHTQRKHQRKSTCTQAVRSRGILPFLIFFFFFLIKKVFVYYCNFNFDFFFLPTSRELYGRINTSLWLSTIYTITKDDAQTHSDIEPPHAPRQTGKLQEGRLTKAGEVFPFWQPKHFKWFFPPLHPPYLL